MRGWGRLLARTTFLLRGFKAVRQSRGSLVLFERRTAAGRELLARWNTGWGGYFFVGGHQHPNESSRQCLIREIAEELSLEVDKDFSLEDQPVLQLRYTAASASAGVDTAYRLDVFRGLILSGEAYEQIEAAPETRWLTIGEVETRRANNGGVVTPTMQTVVRRLKDSGCLLE